MCVGNLFGGGQKTVVPAPRSVQPQPTMRAAAPPTPVVQPKDIKPTGDEEKISTRKKKALEIKKTQEGTKQLGAIDPGALPKSPPGGINV
tara:strand:- start:809 stop:1078 length:270 start_codon:yes stop_codon:yes gene_type:complete